MSWLNDLGTNLKNIILMQDRIDRLGDEAEELRTDILDHGNRLIRKDQLDYFPFPMVESGQGHPDDTLGAINGWLVTKGAPPEAVDFLRFFLNRANQAEMARRNLHIPMTRGAAEALTQPLLKRMAADFAQSPYFQLVYDQMLGRGGGLMVNELSAALAAGSIAPEEAARDLQDEWQLQLQTEEQP